MNGRYVAPRSWWWMVRWMGTVRVRLRVCERRPPDRQFKSYFQCWLGHERGNFPHITTLEEMHHNGRHIVHGECSAFVHTNVIVFHLLDYFLFVRCHLLYIVNFYLLMSTPGGICQTSFCFDIWFNILSLQWKWHIHVLMREYH